MRTELATFEDPNECFAYFNPVHETDYKREVADWSRGIMIFLEEISKADLEKGRSDLKHSVMQNQI